MSTVLNRTTKELRSGVSTASYDVGEWITNPDFSNVEGISSDYWKISGDSIVEMNSSEKTAVDVTKLAEEKNILCEKLRIEVREFIYSRYSQERQQTLAVLRTEARIDNITNRANYIGQVLVWMDQVLTYYYTQWYTIQAQPSRAAVAAYTWNFDSLVTADPIVSIETAKGIVD